jgi:UDP-hydrolysing UDP-N-acetyl-D-glucosamine 2-epimerase
MVQKKEEDAVKQQLPGQQDDSCFKRTRSRRRVAVMVTNRANYGRVKSVLLSIRESPKLDLQLVVAAPMRTDDSEPLEKRIQEDGFPLAGCIRLITDCSNSVEMTRTTASMITELSTSFLTLHPDIVMALGDRYEVLAVAIAAAYLGVPLAHLQGGELSGSIDEKVRHAVTKLSDIHFVSNSNARARLLAMGESPNSVYVTGCPSMDIALPLRRNREMPIRIIAHYFSRLDHPNLEKPYLVFIQHPVTSQQGQFLQQVWGSLQAIAKCGMQTLMFLPNVDPGADEILSVLSPLRASDKAHWLYICSDMPPELFLRVVANSKCVVGNSSVSIRECSFLGVPAVNIGIRQRNRDRGPNVLDVPHDPTEILSAIQHQLMVGTYPTSDLYGDGHAGPRIARILSNKQFGIEKVYEGKV